MRRLVGRKRTSSSFRQNVMSLHEISECPLEVYSKMGFTVDDNYLSLILKAPRSGLKPGTYNIVILPNFS